MYPWLWLTHLYIYPPTLSPPERDALEPLAHPPHPRPHLFPYTYTLSQQNSVQYIMAKRVLSIVFVLRIQTRCKSIMGMLRLQNQILLHDWCWEKGLITKKLRTQCTLCICHGDPQRRHSLDDTMLIIYADSQRGHLICQNTFITIYLVQKRIRRRVRRTHISQLWV